MDWIERVDGERGWMEREGLDGESGWRERMDGERGTGWRERDWSDGEVIALEFIHFSSSFLKTLGWVERKA